MLVTSALTWAAALVGLSAGRPAEQMKDAATTAYYDSDTGFTFSEYRVAYTLTANVAVRIAVPSTATSSSGYDVVLQMVVPNAIGWAGLAWGGNMIMNPLTVSWTNANTPVLSSRWATSHSTPTSYSGASWEKLKAGNKNNGTHWQFSAKCTGCTAFAGSNGNTVLNPKASNRLAFAYSTSKPSNPSSNTSSIPAHDSPVYWNQDFSAGANSNFAALVTKNGGHSDVSPNTTSRRHE